MASERKCPKCSSLQFYYRTKTDEYHCQKCGHDWKEKVENKEN